MNDTESYEREKRDRKRTEGNKVRTLVIKISEVSCCDIKLKLIVKRNDIRGKPLSVFLFIRGVKREGELTDY
jgi:hypothetical protein